MRSYVILFGLAFLLTLLLTPFVRRWAIAWGAMAMPDRERRIHSQPTPQFGGVAIYLAFILTLCCVPFLGNLVSRNFKQDLLHISRIQALVSLLYVLYNPGYIHFNFQIGKLKI